MKKEEYAEFITRAIHLTDDELKEEIHRIKSRLGMVDTEVNRLKIMGGLICGYCHKKPELVDSSVVYGADTNYGKIWLCKPCNAHVGVHRGTEVPLGRLANPALRSLKKQAHLYFDIIWKRLMSDNVTKNQARRKAYQWLSDAMDIPLTETHIGMFDEDQCSQAIQLSQFKLSEDGQGKRECIDS